MAARIRVPSSRTSRPVAAQCSRLPSAFQIDLLLATAFQIDLLLATAVSLLGRVVLLCKAQRLLSIVVLYCLSSIVYRRPILHLSSPIVVLRNIYRRLLSSYPTSIVVLHVRVHLSVVSGYCHPLLCAILCVCPSVLVFLFHHLCREGGRIITWGDPTLERIFNRVRGVT